MRIFIAASEAVPYAKTGGLADVTGSLFRECRRLGEEAYLFLPLYRRIRESFVLKDTGFRINLILGDRVIDSRILSHNNSVFFLESEEFFDRDELYGTPYGDFPDNARRFIFFSRAVLEAAMAMGLRPDIIHCNDWQTGMIPLYLKTLYNNDFFRKTASVMTIHNMGYQGIFDASEFNLTGLGQAWFGIEGVEFYGRINLLKAGLISADMITTVSRHYAEEILTPDYGHGLDGLLRKRASDLKGVINGIDIEEWNPSNDRLIPDRFDQDDLSGKMRCREKLIRECSLDSNKGEAPLISFVGRLSRQKGIDILSKSVKRILDTGSGLIILGKGDAEFESMVSRIGRDNKGRVFVRLGYDDGLAHKIYGGSDIFLMPSLYEPCGLGQMIAMRYGTIPVARRTGGLADTIEDYDPVRDSGTGFLFDDYTPDALICSIRLAITTYSCKERWERLIKNAMKRDFSWKRSAEEYIDIYKSLQKRKE